MDNDLDLLLHNFSQTLEYTVTLHQVNLSAVKKTTQLVMKINKTATHLVICINKTATCKFFFAYTC